MTSEDFELILIESMLHQNKIEFFKKRRKDYDCSKKEFVFGLKNSFALLEELLFSLGGPYNDVELWYKSSFLQFGVNNSRHDPSIHFTIKRDGKTESVCISTEELPFLSESLEMFFQDIAEKEKSLNDVKDSGSEKSTLPDYSELYSKLINKYFEDIKLDQFTNIIKLKRCDKQYKWLGKKKAEAVRFMKHFNMTYEEMNNCFIFLDKKKLYSGNEKGISLRPSVGINEILNQKNKN